MAITVTKEMLKHKEQYSGTAIEGDDPKKIAADAKLFNRKEIYEVITMIQKVVDHFGYNTAAEVQKVEELIKNELPGNIRGQEKVKDWLIEKLSS